MMIPHYYEDPHTLHVGTMPNRAYYIPASRRSDALVEHRETSDRFQLLNGSWKFRYYASIYDLQDAFYEVGYDASAFDSIPVPSVWQNHGYDHHQYTNIRYPFPADPPYVPKENPCGAYLYDFTYQKDAAAPRAFLNFEGVASCFYVWLNGQFVGYSQVAHSTSEFDVTKFLQDGTNHLAVLVLKWCDGSYMEDQDMFRMNGIFRDVYLLHRPEQCIEDYFITTDIHGSTAGVAVRLRYYDSAVATRITLYDAAGTIVGSVTPVEAPDDAAFPYHAEITVVDPTLWNAEQPYLYTLVLDTPNEIITDRVGIREVHVANNQIYVNGQSIKFHGVNRHESDPVTGYAVGFEQTKKDLLMIKKHNFNAIRTSHYPDVPYFYQLCDQYGFFVIDEADNESHGASEYYCEGNESWPNHVENWNKPIADNPEFTEATVDRTRLCVERDKNRPCVIIWSMGNESAYGCTFEEALAWTKSFDPHRLTHYESAQYRSKNRKFTAGAKGHQYDQPELVGPAFAQKPGCYVLYQSIVPLQPVQAGYRNHPDRFYQHAAHPARGQSVEHHRAEYLGGGGAGGHPGCELFYQDVQKVDGQHPHPVPPPEPRTVTPENKRTTKSPYRKAETGKSRFSGMGFAIGKGANRRLFCREEKLEQVKNEEKRKYNDKNQSSTSAQEAPGSARLAVSVGARWGKGEQ